MSPITVDRTDLLKAVGAVRPVAARGRMDLPIFCGVRLAVRSRHLFVECTDGVRRATLLVAGAECNGTRGEVVVEPRRLLDVAKALPTGPVDVDFGTEGVKVDSGTMAVTVSAIADPADWPKAPTAHQPRPIDLSDDDLWSIQRIAPFASKDYARPIICAVFIGDGWAVGSDSYRLAAAPVDAYIETPILLPADDVALLPVDGEAVVWEDGRRASWQSGPLGVHVQLTDGKFPDWRRLVPGPLPHRATFNRQALIGVIRQLEAVGGKDNNRPVHLAAAQGGLTVSLDNAGVKASDRVTAEVTSGWPTIAFNPTFLREGLEALVEDEATLQTGDPLRPGLLQEDDFMYLLMPVRIS